MDNLNQDFCPICFQPYREENMVECNNCNKWCCYECVDVDDGVAEIPDWECPICTLRKTLQVNHKQTSQERKFTTPTEISHVSRPGPSVFRPSSAGSHLSRKGSVSSYTQMRLQALDQEREVLRRSLEITNQEPKLTREYRKILDEDLPESQNVSDHEGEDPLLNQILSWNIENKFDQRQHAMSSSVSLGKDKRTTHPLAPPKESAKNLLSSNNQPSNKVPPKKMPTKPAYLETTNVYKLTSQQLDARRNLSTELPSFSGNPQDWPLFISNYKRTTALCGFNNDENLVRLQKCLKGAARTCVNGFIILPECVPEIISTLEILYGRPEKILESYVDTIKNMPAPNKDKLETIVEFSMAVKNLCLSLKAAQMEDYLHDKLLLQDLLKKLPTQFKIDWATHKSNILNFKGLCDFSDWLYKLAINLYEAMPKLSPYEEKSYSHVHTEQDNLAFKCQVCESNCKNVSECSQFKNYSILEKKEYVKKFNLCKFCLKRHRFPCKYPVKCVKENCKDRHHPLLHESLNSVNQKTEFNMTLIHPFSTRFRLVPVVIKNNENEINTFAFLDEGSSVTLMNKDLAQKLNLHGKNEQLCLKWTANQTRLENSEKVVISISGAYQGAKEFKSRAVRTVDSLNLPEQSLDVTRLKENFYHLRNLQIQSYYNITPEILIGLDNWDLAIPLQVREGKIGDPMAAKCRLGWSIFALTRQSEEEYSYHICKCNKNDQQLFDTVKEYFSIESLGVQNIKSATSKDMERAKNLQETTLSQNENNYKIGLLWKYNEIKLPESKFMAIKRLECLERRIRLNPDLGTKINEQLSDFLEKNYIRILNEEELSKTYKKTWYLPIFPVTNPNKPDKFRLVWDAAAKVKGVSLNDMLLKGDDQLSSLFGVLLRFRERKVGFSADIREMFLRVGVIEEDQQAQRFLWRGGNPENPLDTYVMTVMTFGATCSPSNAQYVKNKNAEKFILEFPRAVNCILNNHYVDDLLDSADTEEEAIEVAKQVTLIHAKGNFEIRNWCSNSTKLTNTMNTNGNKKVEIKFDAKNEKSTEKVLGMWWDLKTDSFVYSLRFSKGNKDVLNGIKKPTKREVLKILMSIYDPLGLLSHFVIFLKIFLQEIWRSNLTWDEPITDTQNESWLIWLKHLPKIEHITIPRCYLKTFPNWEQLNIQLHIFVDASEHASATVAYLRMKNQNNIECTLIGSKTHIAPIRPKTIPRLELDAAVMGARFAKSLSEHLSISIKKITYCFELAQKR